MGVAIFPQGRYKTLRVTTKAVIGDASSDTIGLFGDAAAAQQSTPDDADVTAAANSVATQFNLLLDRLTTSGILGGT